MWNASGDSPVSYSGYENPTYQYINNTLTSQKHIIKRSNEVKIEAIHDDYQ